MIEAHLKCDNVTCNWSIEEDFHEIPKWLNKSCPKCRKCIIVTDFDMMVWNETKKALDISSSSPNKPKVQVKIDTACLR